MKPRFIEEIENLPDYIQEMLNDGSQKETYPERAGVYEGALIFVKSKLEFAILLEKAYRDINPEADPLAAIKKLEELISSR